MPNTVGYQQINSLPLKSALQLTAAFSSPDANTVATCAQKLNTKTSDKSFFFNLRTHNKEEK